MEDKGIDGGSREDLDANTRDPRRARELAGELYREAESSLKAVSDKYVASNVDSPPRLTLKLRRSRF